MLKRLKIPFLHFEQFKQILQSRFILEEIYVDVEDRSIEAHSKTFAMGMLTMFIKICPVRHNALLAVYDCLSNG